jgi:hypothetical protein
MSILSLHRPHWIGTALLHRSDHGVHSTMSVPTLTSGERILREAVHNGSVIAVGTDVALHHRTSGGAWRRIAWIDLAAVSWSARTGSVRLQIVGPGRQVQTIDVAADAALAAFAAERLTHAHVIRRRVELRPGVFGIVEAVRESDSAAARWRVQLEHPEHGEDPVVRQACRDVISELRSLTGC